MPKAFLTESLQFECLSMQAQETQNPTLSVQVITQYAYAPQMILVLIYFKIYLNLRYPIMEPQTP